MNALEHTMLGIDRILNGSPSSPDGQHGRKSALSGAQQELSGEDPHVGLGTAEAGTPIVRYWTVRFRHGGSALWDYTQVIACDPFKAAMVVSNRRPLATETAVVREINREEFEHLTRSSP
jgi:hypothetical protein